MYLPSFDLSKASWDRYHAFHINHPERTERYWNDAPFVQFDTGELIITDYNFKPDQRKNYPALGITITSTIDNDCPRFLTEGGSPIPKTYLQHKGGQHLLIDHETGVVVRLHDYLQNGEPIPSRMRGYAVAYFPGAGRRPIGSPILVTHERRIEPGHKALLNETVAACKAMVALDEETTMAMKKKFGIGRHVIEGLEVPLDDVLGKKFTELTAETQYCLATFGVKQEFTTTKHDHLVLA